MRRGETLHCGRWHAQEQERKASRAHKVYSVTTHGVHAGEEQKAAFYGVKNGVMKEELANAPAETVNNCVCQILLGASHEHPTMSVKYVVVLVSSNCRLPFSPHR